MKNPATTRLEGTAHYFVTDEIAYPHPPSEVCAAARSQLGSIMGWASRQPATMSSAT